MSDAELAGARVRQLLELTRRLTERLAAETRAFQEGAPRRSPRDWPKPRRWPTSIAATPPM
jgi:hypothetical protein